MIKTFRATIAKYSMVSRGDRVGVAVSGGPDSIALLHGLLSLVDEYSMRLVIIHLNHGLRSHESDSEEAFVHDQGRALDIPVIRKKISVPDLCRKDKGSVEDICRRERYRFFEEAADFHKLDKIALGHTKNDQAETVIMKILRGSGSGGLKGMFPVRDGIYIRPLIELSRKAIESFLESKGLMYVTDSSNRDILYLRNRIRHHLIPDLENNYNPKIVDSLSHLSGILRRENDFIEKAADKYFTRWKCNVESNEVEIDIRKFQILHSALQFRIVKRLLKNGAQPAKEIGYVHVKAVIDLIFGSKPNARIDLPDGITVYREYDRFTIYRGQRNFISERTSSDCRKKICYRNDKQGVNDYIYEVSVPGLVHISETGRGMKFDYVAADQVDYNSGTIAYIDLRGVTPPLVVRNFRAGDTIQPLGMTGTKKLKSIFIDAKVPKRDRGLIPLLVDASSVIWIPGLRLHDRVKVADTTGTVIRVEMI